MELPFEDLMLIVLLAMGMARAERATFAASKRIAKACIIVDILSGCKWNVLE